MAKKKKREKGTEQKGAGEGSLKPDFRGLMQEIEIDRWREGESPHAPRTALDEAQEVIHKAWKAGSAKEAWALAMKALSISSDCADAFNLLAEAAGSMELAAEIYRQGVAAGERALGEKAFKEDVGEFWGLIETRPYMRARFGLGQCLWEIGRHDEAIEHYKDLLRLNPNDNQAVRLILMPWLLQTRRFEEAEALYKEYEKDPLATWVYSRALLDFQKGGDCARSRESLAKAIEENRFVPAYLTGRKKLPDYLPDTFQPGHDDEAAFYAEHNFASWEAVPVALEWLAVNAK